MPRRSSGTTDATAVTPGERRVTRSALRRSVEGTPEKTPEKPKATPKTTPDVKPSPSGKRGRPSKKQSIAPVEDDKQVAEGEVKMDVGDAPVVDATVSKSETDSAETVAVEAASKQAADAEAGEKKEEKEQSVVETETDKPKQEESVETKKRQREEETEAVGEESGVKKPRSDNTVVEVQKVESSLKPETDQKVAENMETTPTPVCENTAEKETVVAEIATVDQSVPESAGSTEKSSENGCVGVSSVPVSAPEPSESKSKDSESVTTDADLATVAPPTEKTSPVDIASNTPVAETVNEALTSKKTVSVDSNIVQTSFTISDAKQNGCHGTAIAETGC